MAKPIQMKGSTPVSGETLCKSCKNAFITKGQDLQERIVCQWYGGDPWNMNPVPYKIAECTGYKVRNAMTLGEMKEVAWEIRVKSKDNKGFGSQIKPEDLEYEIVKPEKKEGRQAFPEVKDTLEDD